MLFPLERAEYWHRVLSRYMLIRIVENAGQTIRMFIKALALFRLLKVLLASTKRMASVVSLSKSFLTECTAASIPAICPPQSCRDPAASWMSPLMTKKTVFEMILRATSQTPMGCTTGFLSRSTK